MKNLKPQLVNSLNIIIINLFKYILFYLKKLLRTILQK